MVVAALRSRDEVGSCDYRGVPSQTRNTEYLLNREAQKRVSKRHILLGNSTWLKNLSELNYPRIDTSRASSVTVCFNYPTEIPPLDGRAYPLILAKPPTSNSIENFGILCSNLSQLIHENRIISLAEAYAAAATNSIWMTTR